MKLAVISTTILTMAMILGTAMGAQQPGVWSGGAEHPVITLWPNGVLGGAPGPKTVTGAEGDMTKPEDKLIAGRPIIKLGNVAVPTLTLYAPKGKSNGAAVVVFPGGGYSILAIDLEGVEVCDWLTARGITCLVLKYRVPDTGPYPKSAAALQDAQRAMGLVRAHAAEFNIDPKRIGVLGFSAGGHLAAALSTHFDDRVYAPIDAADRQSCRPDFAVIIYPGYLALPEAGFALNPEVPVTNQVPPTFLVQAEDDPVHVENSTTYFLALKSVGVPVEMHLYAKGGHGYGLRRTDLPVTTWPDRVDEWMKTIGVVR